MATKQANPAAPASPHSNHFGVRLIGSKDMTLFVNLSKVWIASGGDSTGTSRGYDIVGFSVAPRKNR